MSVSESSNLISRYGLLATHVALAHCPLAIALVPLGVASLPIMWALASIPFAQIMLLAIWVGLVRPPRLKRLAASAAAIAYAMIWPTAGEILSSNYASVSMFLHSYALQAALTLACVVIFSLALVGASRVIGRIVPTSPDDSGANAKPLSFSLLAALIATTIVALVLGLMRASRTPGGDAVDAVQFVLAVVVFCINIIVTVWACLGPAPVGRRLLVVFIVALLLGLAVTLSAGHSLDSEPWWLFASAGMIVVLPTAIVATTLLVVRRRGFRLRPAAASTPA